MPVGRGSIARATNASSKVASTAVKETTLIPNVLTDIPVEQIHMVPKTWTNPKYQKASVKELIASIQKFGMIEPIILRRIDESKFQLLSGQGRLQAVKEMGVEVVTSRVLDGLSDKEAKELYQDLHQSRTEESTDLHEVKFKAFSSLSRPQDMPNYLL